MTSIFDYQEKGLEEKVASLLQEGKVGIIPCDTIYGISARANKETAERILEIKRRPKNKNFITLYSKELLKKSDLDVPEKLYSVWPAPLTAILKDSKGITHAVRVPKDDFIQRLIPLSGPIWSSSVNFSGEPSLTNFDAIAESFMDLVDFIIRKPMPEKGVPSTLIDCTNAEWNVIREGAFDIKALGL
ncbi:MAG: L-threonylcarbamoyladenylate synthase [Sphaerochaetaceae bacterium]|nr:L-threonylcarbamoyladenylate synthase [Sphaerochaetaceae bacterium]